MKNKTGKLVAALVTLLLLGILQPALTRADDACRGIGGTGRSTLDCGIGGTGNSPVGIGGTGHSGVGGTGAVANQAGIGGTGHSDGGIGGTGIVGTITGFGSIWVNGVEVQYDAKTPVESNDPSENANDLAIGQVVVIEAKGNDKDMRAEKISVVNAVAGRITALDEQNGKFSVLGQTVDITARTISHDRQNTQANIQLKQGDYVRVNGLRSANGEIVASRIVRDEPKAESSVIGPVTGINGKTIEVYGLKVDNVSGSTFSLGQEVAVTGSMTGDKLSARAITPSPTARLYERTAQINLQGYVSEAASGGIKVGGMDVVVPGASADVNRAEKPNPGDLIQVIGHFDKDHRIIVDRIEFGRDRMDRMQLDHIGKDGAVDKVEHVDHSDHVDRADHVDHVDRPDKPDRSYNSDNTNQHSEHSHK